MLFIFVLIVCTTSLSLPLLSVTYTCGFVQSGGREKETMEGKVEMEFSCFCIELKKSQNVTTLSLPAICCAACCAFAAGFVAERECLAALLTMPKKVGGRGNPNTVCLYE